MTPSQTLLVKKLNLNMKATFEAGQELESRDLGSLERVYEFQVKDLEIQVEIER